jgi:SAM-dependent methyltransferase
VLDAGCGCGRFAEVAAEKGARVIAVDYSRAVDAAARNLGRFPNVAFVQGDLLRPPIKEGAVPFVYSIGVLQHTPDPCRALASVLRLLAPGGRFAFTIYGRRWYTRLNAKYLIRPLTRRLPPRLLLRAIEALMPVVFPVTDMVFSLPVLGRVAQFMIPVANYVDKTGFTPGQRYREAILDTFDMLSPAFDRPMTADEVRGVFARLGIDDYHFLTTVPVVVSGSVPYRSGSNGQRPLAVSA